MRCGRAETAWAWPVEPCRERVFDQAWGGNPGCRWRDRHILPGCRRTRLGTARQPLIWPSL